MNRKAVVAFILCETYHYTRFPSWVHSILGDGLAHWLAKRNIKTEISRYTWEFESPVFMNLDVKDLNREADTIIGRTLTTRVYSIENFTYV